MSKNQENVKATMEAVLAAFNSGRALDVIAIATLPRQDIPCAKWSLCNRFIMMLSGTGDARGYRQWQTVGRYVVKGAHAFTILAPRIVTDKADEEGEEKTHVAGFLGVPVFRLEDTEGNDLPNLAPETPPPLADVAERFGVDISYANLLTAYGAYSPGQERIVLDTHDTHIYFHELSHAAHKRVSGSLKGGQDRDQEILAEFCAAVLSRIYTPDYPLGFAKEYTGRYAGKDTSPSAACLRLLRDAEKILAEIFQAARVAVGGSGGSTAAQPA